MRDLAVAVALLLVIEGGLYALFPGGMKRMIAEIFATARADDPEYRPDRGGVGTGHFNHRRQGGGLSAASRRLFGDLAYS